MCGDGERKLVVTDSVTENIPPLVERPGVRVKRRGKSPPPGAQATGHDKPRVVQDRTEDLRRLRPFRKEWSPRVLVAPRSRGPQPSLAGAEKWSSGSLRTADRIRLMIGHQNRRGHPKGCPRRLVFRRSRPAIRIQGVSVTADHESPNGCTSREACHRCLRTVPAGASTVRHASGPQRTSRRRRLVRGSEGFSMHTRSANLKKGRRTAEADGTLHRRSTRPKKRAESEGAQGRSFPGVSLAVAAPPRSRLSV